MDITVKISRVDNRAELHRQLDAGGESSPIGDGEIIRQAYACWDAACVERVGLDPIGRRIWALLAAPQQIGAPCCQPGEKFDGTREQIAARVLVFLEELASEGMVPAVDAHSA